MIDPSTAGWFEVAAIRNGATTASGGVHVIFNSIWLAYYTI